MPPALRGWCCAKTYHQQGEVHDPVADLKDVQLSKQESSFDQNDESLKNMNLNQLHTSQKFVQKWEREQKFTKDQQTAMQNFRKRAYDAGILPTHFDNKPFIYRFCKARDYDVDKAFLMYSRHMEWREKWGLNDWIDKGHGPMPRMLYDFKFSDRKKHKDAYNHVHHKTDKLGRLVYVDRAGSLDAKKVLSLDQDQLLKAYIWDCEATLWFRLPACSVKSRKHIGKTLTIIDLKGLGLSLLTDSKAKAYLKTIIGVSQDNYPEMLGKMFIINAPKIFSMLWKFISPMLEQHTRDKISVMSNKSTWLPKLQELMESGDIPVFLGGTDSSLDYVNEQGPWTESLPDIRQ